MKRISRKAKTPRDTGIKYNITLQDFFISAGSKGITFDHLILIHLKWNADGFKSTFLKTRGTLY